MVAPHVIALCSNPHPLQCWPWRPHGKSTRHARSPGRACSAVRNVLLLSSARSLFGSLYVLKEGTCSQQSIIEQSTARSRRRHSKISVSGSREEVLAVNKVEAGAEYRLKETASSRTASSFSRVLSLVTALEGRAMGAIKSCVVLALMMSLALGAVAEVDDAAVPYIRRGRRPDIPLFALEQLEKPDAMAPEQVHVALAGPNTMRVSWVTKDKEVPSKVEFGTVAGKLDRVAQGEHLTYSFLNYKSPTIHHVVLGSDIPLKDDTEYFYRCGGHTHEFSFKTPPPVGPNIPINFSVIGDLGQTGWSVSTLEHMSRDDADMVLHAGDLSYADFYQPRWDSWGRLIEPLASSIPWMVTEGNHEIESVGPFEPRFKAYNARWPMPFEESGSPSNLFYSFETASCHILMLGSYTDYAPGSPQYRWLQEDLAKVDRARTPWLVVVLHAPWYNSNEAHQEEAVGMMEALEPMLVNARVDVLFAGHVHAYERSVRVNQGVADPCGMVHVTIGDAGNREGLASRYLEDTPAWSVKREASFGHGTFEIANRTHAMWKWHRNQDDEDVVADKVWILSHSDAKDACPIPMSSEKAPSLRMRMSTASQ